MIYEKIEITDAGAEGMAIGKIGEKVVFVPFVVPGDVVDVQIVRKKRDTLKVKPFIFTSIPQNVWSRIVPISGFAVVAGGRE